MDGDLELAFDSVAVAANATLRCVPPSAFVRLLVPNSVIDIIITTEPRLVRGRIMHDLFFGRIHRPPADEFGRLVNNQLQGRG